MFRQKHGEDADQRRERVRLVKRWVEEELGLDDQSTVMVSELTCTEPGCPPLETVVAVLRPHARRQAKLHKPVAELTREDVMGLCARLGDEEGP